MAWQRATLAIAQTQHASSAFLEASASAVSAENTPGRRADGCRAVCALQEALRSGTAVAHKEEAFEAVRRHFGRSEAAYCAALLGELRLVDEEEAAGKSNAFFVFTEDGRYCVKRVPESEARSLLTVIEDYRSYVMSQETLLPRFYGLYEVQLEDECVWLMVQGNVLGGRAGVLQRFDLKGSTHGRRASKKELSKGASVLKDLDFVFNGCSVQCLTAEASKTWQQWVRCMESDSKWLAKHGLMDYSLLLGFSTCSLEEVKKPLSHVIRLELDPSSLGYLPLEVPNGHCLLLYAGIVDCLMPYTLKKRVENLICDILLSGDISCQPPEKYARRFQDFVGRLASDDLISFTLRRQRRAWRPFSFLGELGRKDFQASRLTILGLLGLTALAWRVAR